MFRLGIFFLLCGPFLPYSLVVSWIRGAFARRAYFFVTVRIFLLTFICGSFIL